MRKNFNDIYEKIHKESKEELDKLKSKNTKDTIMLLLIISILVFTLNFIDKLIMLITLFFGMIVFITFVAKHSHNFRALYKSKVIQILVNGYSEKLHYYPLSTMTKAEYAASGFDYDFYKMTAEDQINGFLEDGSSIKMSEVTTIKREEYRNEDGTVETREYETFRGLYGYIRLKNPIFNLIRLKSNSILERYTESRIELESAEFEKKYDLHATNKLEAMQIFTSDLIEKIIKLNYNERCGFELKIEGEMIYFRYRCGEIFEPPTLSSGVDFNLLLKYFSIINFPVEVIETVIENAEHARGV